MSSISEGERGNRGLGLSTLIRIAQAFNVSLNWLALGLGPQYLSENRRPFTGDPAILLYQFDSTGLPPGLKEFLANDDLMAKLKPTSEEITDMASATAGDLLHFGATPEFFVDLLLAIRRGRYEATRAVYEELRHSKPKP